MTDFRSRHFIGLVTLTLTFWPLSWVTGHPCRGLPSCQFSAFLLPFHSRIMVRHGTDRRWPSTLVAPPYGAALNKKAIILTGFAFADRVCQSNSGYWNAVSFCGDDAQVKAADPWTFVNYCNWSHTCRRCRPTTITVSRLVVGRHCMRTAFRAAIIGRVLVPTVHRLSTVKSVQVCTVTYGRWRLFIARQQA